jgi:hypothetical protein
VFGGLSSLLGTYRAGYAALMVIATASGSLLLWNHLRGR